MKIIKDLQVPQDTNRSKWPFGQIKNETETEAGTPVVREIYGDILSNAYKILQDAGITPNGIEDSEDSGYQLLEALKKFTNELNDIEQVVSLSGTEWSVNLDIDKLPNKYVLFCRMADAYKSGVAYTFSGTGNDSYPLVSPTGFKASDEVLLVLDQSGVRVYSFSAVAQAATGGLFPVLGNPVAYNDTDLLYYESEGKLITDTPSIFNLQQTIRLAVNNSTLYVNEILILKGYVLAVTFDTTAETYRFFQFNLNDLGTVAEVNLPAGTIPTGVDNSPYVYTDGVYIYISNSSGSTANDYELDKFSYDSAAEALTFSQAIELDQSFVKTTNVVVKDGFLISFVGGILTKFNLGTGTPTALGDFNTLLGIIFNHKGEVYYSNGEVAKKWTV